MSENEDQQVVKAEGAGKTMIGIKVVGHDGSSMLFKVNEGKSLEKLMKVYCEKMNLDPSAVRFLFDGERINKNNTPASMGLTEGGEIEVKVTMDGGVGITEVTDEDDPNKQINVKVVGQDDSVVQFMIKKQTSFEKLMKKYCERMGLDPAAVRFLFDGDRVQRSDTPKGVGMEDGDKLEVEVRMDGGGKTKKVEGSDKKICLKMPGQKGSVIQFMVRKDKPLAKMLQVYCKTMNFMDPWNVRYWYNCERFLPSSTPNDLNMEDGDELEVFFWNAGRDCHCGGGLEVTPGCPRHDPFNLQEPGQEGGKVEPEKVKPEETKPAQEVKVKKEGTSKMVDIKVIGLDQSVLEYKAHRDKLLARLMESYCKTMNLDDTSVRFHIDGKRVQRYNSPNGLKLEDAVSMEVFILQNSGGAGPLCDAVTAGKGKVAAPSTWDASGLATSQVPGSTLANSGIRVRL